MEAIMKLKQLYLFAILYVISSFLNAQDEWIELDLEDETYFETDQEFNQAEYEIEIKSGEWLEMKVAMNANDVIVYNLTSDVKSPEQLIIEFHGHTEPTEGQKGTVMFYTKHNSDQEKGSLVASFSGIHGWYLNNESLQDITVKLAIAGFFEKTE